MGLLPPWFSGSVLETWAGKASQLCGWLGVTHPHIQEQTAVAQQEGQRGTGPSCAKFVCVYFDSSAQHGNNMLHQVLLLCPCSSLSGDKVVAWLRPALSFMEIPSFLPHFQLPKERTEAGVQG